MINVVTIRIRRLRGCRAVPSPTASGSDDDRRPGLEAGRGRAPIAPGLGEIRHVGVLALEDGANGLHALSVPHLGTLVIPEGGPKLAMVQVPVVLTRNVLTTKLGAEVFVVEVWPVHLIYPNLSRVGVIPCAGGLPAGAQALAAWLIFLALRSLVLDVHGGALPRQGVPNRLVARPGVVVRRPWDLASHDVAVICKDLFLAVVATQRIKCCKWSEEALADVEHDLGVVDRDVQPKHTGDVIMSGAALDHHLVVEVPQRSRQGSKIVVGPVEFTVVLRSVHVKGKRLGGSGLHARLANLVVVWEALARTILVAAETLSAARPSLLVAALPRRRPRC